jgi:hypothetical protein
VEDNRTISGCGGSELPTGKRLASAEQRPIKHPVGRPKIDDAEEIGCVWNKCEVVPSRGSRIEMELCRTAA